MRNSFFVTSVVFTLLGLWDDTSGAYDKVCTIEDTKNHVYMCGSLWADTLSMLCHPHGYAPGKRSAPSDETDVLQTITNRLKDNKEDERNSIEHPLFLPKSKALSYIKIDVKRTQWQTIGEQNVFWGATCECCHNRCSIQEMAQYCLNPDAALESWGLGRK